VASGWKVIFTICREGSWFFFHLLKRRPHFDLREEELSRYLIDWDGFVVKRAGDHGRNGKTQTQR
jgi:hypothetical protein